MIKIEQIYTPILVTMLAIDRLSCFWMCLVFKVENEILLHISVFIVCIIALQLLLKIFDSLLK